MVGAALGTADLPSSLFCAPRTQLDQLLAAMAAGPKDELRSTGTPAAELGLFEPSASDELILEAMVAF